MPITSLPIVGEGEALGPVKSDRRQITSTEYQVAASEWNALAALGEAVAADLGLSSGATTGTINAQRYSNLTEIGGALADTDHVIIFDASASNAPKKSLLSRFWTQLAASLPIAYGTWTPTGTATTNLDAVTPGTGTYLRVGSIVIAGVKVSIDATAAAAIELALSLPVASNFSDDSQLFGVLAGALTGGRIFSDATNDRAQAFGTATTTAAVTGGAFFIYRVI
jgi:hypothetical protein